MEKASRRLYAWLAFSAFFGLALSLVLSALNIDAVVIKDQTLFHQDTASIRIFGFFSYFTIWSNIVVVIVGLSVWRKRTTYKYFQTLVAAGLIMITVTGLVYNLVLLPAFPPKGWYWLTSTLMHVIAPIFYNYLWFTRGPRGAIAKSHSLQILGISIIYLCYTLVRGLAIKQWPYKFLDLTSEGLLMWIIGVSIIFGFGFALIAMYSKIDRKRSLASN